MDHEKSLADPRHMLDLQARLLNDTSGALREQLRHRLRTLQAECVNATRRLNDRDTYKALQAASGAIEAALRFVESPAGSPQGRA